MLRPHYVPPSLLVEGLFCKRRLWLKSRNVEIFEETQLLARARTLKEHINGTELDDSGWLFEARLPSGTRLDAWVPEESLGVEFKSGKPHATHIYQVWAIRQELNDLCVPEAELQLWYPSSFEAEAIELAEEFNLDHGPVVDGVYALCADSEAPDFSIRLERTVSILLGDIESETIPATKESSSLACKSCAYFSFCYC